MSVCGEHLLSLYCCHRIVRENDGENWKSAGMRRKEFIFVDLKWKINEKNKHLNYFSCISKQIRLIYREQQDN